MSSRTDGRNGAFTPKRLEIRHEAQRLRKISAILMQQREALTRQSNSLREESIALEKKLLVLEKIAEKKRNNMPN